MVGRPVQSNYRNLEFLTIDQGYARGTQIEQDCAAVAKNEKHSQLDFNFEPRKTLACMYGHIASAYFEAGFLLVENVALCAKKNVRSGDLCRTDRAFSFSHMILDEFENYGHAKELQENCGEDLNKCRRPTAWSTVGPGRHSAPLVAAKFDLGTAYNSLARARHQNLTLKVIE